MKMVGYNGFSMSNNVVAAYKKNGYISNNE